ncbi:MAG: SUF system NifU family Fe-S cluster assembly protein [Gammaproteobacteria bacterium]|nr:SUF system NifU family Fe-S cluster assembly protein [Gammaproteobacteria bacterium]
MNELRELYEEVILDHNRNPRNYPKKPDHCNHTAHGFNPLCGDQVQVHLYVDNGKVVDVGFEGDGCAISTASASMMTEAIKGRDIAEVQELFGTIHTLLTDSSSEVDEDALGKLAVMIGVREFPMRVKCATLAWHTMQAALNGEEKASTE